MTTDRRLFIKQIGLGIAGLGITTTLPETLYAHQPVKGISLPRSTPEQQGVSSTGILEFIDAVEKSKIEFHSFMVLRHGHVIAEGWWAPYAAPLKHTLYSLSKSFTSTAVGFAVSEGKLKVEDKVISFFPGEVPAEISANLAAMRVKDLLTMSTGHATDTMPGLRAAADGNWIKAFLAQPVEFEPGTHFLYNTGATYMCSAIVQKLTGQTLMEYLKPRLFDPLGIEGMDWEVSPQGINTGGYGLRVRTEDIGRFGQLYLQKGMWQGRQLLPAAWIDEATSKQVNSQPGNPAQQPADNDWAQGYGYQFWRCTPGGYRGDGAFGQLCVVMPDKDAVIVVTEESFNMQASMKLVWQHLLPAMKAARTLPADAAAQKQLKSKLASLALDIPKVQPTSPWAARVSGKIFTVADNEYKIKSLSLRFTDKACVLAVTDDKGTHDMQCGLNTWLESNNKMGEVLFQWQARTNITSRTLASATWTDEQTLQITERHIETAHSDQIIFVFADQQLTVKFLGSVPRGNPNNAEKRTELKGTLTV
jgi:CubicO group peptidase (beta-lactamase class C family)